MIISQNKIALPNSKIRNTNYRIISNGLFYHINGAIKSSYSGAVGDRNIKDISSSGVGNFSADTNVSYSQNSFNLSLNRYISKNPEFNTFSFMDVTMSFWIKGNNSSQDQYLVDSLSMSGSAILIVLNSSFADTGLVVYWVDDLNNNYSSGFSVANGNLLNNKWNCYTFRRDSNNSPYTDHFINGIKIGTINRVGSQVTNPMKAEEYYIGASGGTFFGKFGAAHTYSRALSDEEIMYNYIMDRNRFT